jgi:DNA polymerase-3 subunit gamma/tau
MENFVVSARKYRPALFDSVVGQSHITTTLKNAIRTNHLAQAFLFCEYVVLVKLLVQEFLQKLLTVRILRMKRRLVASANRVKAFKITHLSIFTN